MPDFDSHLNQSKHNLKFFKEINDCAVPCLDWQVTVVFYAGVHLINAHLAKIGLQYRTHIDVDAVISPYGVSPAKVPERVYVAYNSLQILSRRSRYLVNKKGGNMDALNPALTYGKHLDRAIGNLDIIIEFFEETYEVKFEKTSLYCNELNHTKQYKYFNVSRRPVAV